MFNLISLNTIKNGNLDAALEKFGYVRAKIMAEKWGLTTDQLNKKISAGYVCDEFKVNNVRYISVDAKKPD